MSDKQYYVYITTNSVKSVLYTGLTNNLVRRIWEHKQKLASSFTSRYNVTKLIYWETFNNSLDAIAREKRIKGGSRAKKLALVRSMNPTFADLYEQITK